MTTYSIARFQRHLGQPCTLHLAESPSLQTELIDVTSLHDSVDPQSRQFSVLWRGPAEPVLNQSIYTVELPDGQRHELFLVPVAKDNQGILYEAVFA